MRNVDIVAVVCLLCGIALYSGLRRAVALGVLPHGRIMIMEHIPRHAVVPPRPPRIPFTRD